MKEHGPQQDTPSEGGQHAQVTPVAVRDEDGQQPHPQHAQYQGYYYS